MKKVTQKINAKINLTLEIVGVENGYHLIKSLVASVNIADAVTLYKRNDGLITIKEKGIKVGGKLQDNNAYKACKAFMDRYFCNGADIIIDKKIPIGGGLGGSSADIAGVLKCMQLLYGDFSEVESLAESLGSDVNYMLKGGYAVISGRGEKVVSTYIKDKFYLLLIFDSVSVSAKQSYGEFDKIHGYGEYKEPFTPSVVKLLENGESEKAFSLCYNDLYIPSATLNPNICKNIDLIRDIGAEYINMSGSGSTVFALFRSKKDRDRAYKNIVKTVGKDKLLKAETVI